MVIRNNTKNTILAENAQIASSLGQRMTGLLRHSRLPAGQALLIKPCNSVHTFFMRFTIDVVFLNKKNQVVRAISGLRPWRLSAIYLSARSCLELPAGTIASTHTSPGDTLILQGHPSNQS